MSYSQGYHFELISKICAYFQGQCLRKRVTCLFLSPVLVFDFLVEKIGYCRREDLFFGLHQIILVEKQDFVDVKTFFF